MCFFQIIAILRGFCNQKARGNCKKVLRNGARVLCYNPNKGKVGLCADWAQMRLKSGGWATLVIRPFGTFSAKQGLSPLLFMLKSNKNLEPVSEWVPNLRNRGKGNKVSLSNPFPTMPETAGRKAARCAKNSSASHWLSAFALQIFLVKISCSPVWNFLGETKAFSLTFYAKK